MKNKILHVIYKNKEVGRLAQTKDNLCAFEYDAQWLLNGFSISPFKLPLDKKVFIADKEPFNGNFGVFDDSLPDGWGRLLIDRMLVKKRIVSSKLSIIDRLAIVGKSGMGALEYYPENTLFNEEFKYDLDELAQECEKILKEEPSSKLEELVNFCGSSGGARPKVLVRHDNADWIVKFRSSNDPIDIGNIEYKYSEIARLAGIDMPETKLFNGKFFGVKRFDRKPSTKTFSGEKIHMLSVCGLLNASHRIPCLDYIDILKATYLLTRDYREVEKLFRLMCFNIIGENRDDHSKNFSFLYDNGEWKLSPAYDLVPSDGIMGEHATMIAGNGKNPDLNDALKVASEIGIKKTRATQIYSEVQKAFESKLKKIATIESIGSSTRIEGAKY